MSEKRLFNAIRRIANLQILNTKSFITSKKIRSKFSPEFSKNFYDSIESFHKLGWIEKMEKDGDYAGDDRREYKLTGKGEELRVQLLYEIMTLLGVSSDTVKEDKINNVLTEFSKQWEGKIDEKLLKELIKILKEILENQF